MQARVDIRRRNRTRRGRPEARDGCRQPHGVSFCAGRAASGVASIQLLVILVPVLFLMMGFGIDLGRLYLIRGELNQAAQAAALAAAPQLIGTSAALYRANDIARLTVNDVTGHANRYNFGSIIIGESNGALNSVFEDPAYFTSLSAALIPDAPGDADGTSARHVRVALQAEGPLVFWSLLAAGAQRKTLVASSAVAGISPPLCTACGIDPVAIAAASTDDSTDFGFTRGTRYTFGYQCSGPPTPQGLANGGARIQYLLLDYYNLDNGLLDEGQQLYRTGAQGLLPSTDSTKACATVLSQAYMWGTAAGTTTATPLACNANRPPAAAVDYTCGLYSRFDLGTTPPDTCSTITDVASMALSYEADSDTSDLDDYTAYAGSTRRVITVAIVDTLSPGSAMTVLGFRQFLIEPVTTASGISGVDPSDSNARFIGLYIGNPVPLRQGRVDGCYGQVTTGPGKVVLHQ
jgi:Flp pilus assembly protein TadG